MNETKLTTFDQLKYIYYRFRTLTFANYPFIPSKAFRFVHFESQSVKQTHRENNRNVIAFVNIEQTHSNIFEELSLSDSSEQLIISFMNSPSLIYANGALSKLSCYELKLSNTNPKIPIEFFSNTISIYHLIIDNPSFIGFLSSSSQAFTFQIPKMSIKDVSVRSLQGKHFPIVFSSTRELTLENYHADGGFRTFNSRELAQRFPQLRTLTIFSRSIQHITKRMFEYFTQLEYLRLTGITTIENEAFYNLHHLKELYLGKHILRLDPYAFLHMNTKFLYLNESLDFQLNDDRHFCVFAQFSPLTSVKTFVQFPQHLDTCSCTIRYLYRHLDKSWMSTTPDCYSNSSLYILSQEERLCYFEQRLLQCHVLPDEGITIFGKHYNVSYFYQRQIFKQRRHLTIFYEHRLQILFGVLAFVVSLMVLICIIRQCKQRKASTYRHLNRLLNRRQLAGNDQITMDIIYHHTNDRPDILLPPPTTTKV
ncbi:unnamed protein product [Adineta ricciae]|uniref:Uncharacterized protein n=1 Tax=Adineta ricciae TaxID=249248 RepID=A0A813R7J9_ADIRI|nr:unnamed protein product [Adineta ricciae]